LGVHISFVRSTTLDTWTQEQLKIMAIGGNQRARQFFKQHGWDEVGSDKIESKYTSRAAQLYRAMLEKEASKVTPQAAVAAATGHAHTAAAGELADFKHISGDGTQGFGDSNPTSPSSQPAPVAVARTSDGGESGAAAAHPKPAGTTHAAAKARLSSTAPAAKKAGGGKLGLGIKKLEAKADDSLFEQAPAPEPVKVSDPLQTAGGGAGVSPEVAPGKSPAGSRFAYDTITEAPAPNVQRGKDGHLTLNTKGNDFFSSGGTGSSSLNKTSFDKAGGSSSSRRGTQDVGEPAVAQQRFGNAKAISSKDFQGGSDRETEYERQAKLQQFKGASSISSADYFGEGGSGGAARGASGDLDISAADLVNRLSFQAKQDIQQMKQLAGSVASKLTGVASKFMNDLGRY